MPHRLDQRQPVFAGRDLAPVEGVEALDRPARRGEMRPQPLERRLLVLDERRSRSGRPRKGRRWPGSTRCSGRASPASRVQEAIQSPTGSASGSVA